jgi:excisionase family DNA binding protein
MAAPVDRVLTMRIVFAYNDGMNRPASVVRLQRSGQRSFEQREAGRVFATEVPNTSSVPAPPLEPSDVFDRLARCETLLTAKDVAKLLAISPKTVYSYVSRNMIPHYRIEANVRFRAQDIAAWLRHQAA